MRNVVVCVVAAVLIVLASPAAAQQREFGLKAGPTFTSLVFDPDDEAGDYDQRVAAVFGGFAVLPLNPRFAAQFEVLYVAKGAKIPTDLEDTSLTFKLNYVEIPVLARVAVTRSAKRSFFVFAGPSFGIRTKASLEDSFNTGGGFIGNAIDVGADYDRFELGLVAGGGVDIGHWVVIDARYAWGLTDIGDNPEFTSSVKNRALTFMAGVRF